MPNPLPEFVTKAQTDAALEALGIPTGIGLTSVEIGAFRVTVTRFVKDDARRPLGDGPVRIEIPIDRRSHPDDVRLSDDPTEPFEDGDTP